MPNHVLHGAGLGFRRPFVAQLDRVLDAGLDFMEVAPENWVDVGGRLGRAFRRLTERMPVVCHGLSLNIGGPAPLDMDFLLRLKRFLREHDIPLYTDHLSYCADDGHLYDLMPIPHTEEAVHYVAGRIRQVQDILDRRMGIENVSYYCAPGQEMREIDFVNSVLEEADCWLHLDINNIYVNSVNHGYDAEAFLKALPGERICHAHVAGHSREAQDLIIDTHGAPVIDPVWRLVEVAYDTFGVFPTMIERDANIPPFEELMKEVAVIQRLQAEHEGRGARAVAHG